MSLVFVLTITYTVTCVQTDSFTGTDAILCRSADGRIFLAIFPSITERAREREEKKETSKERKAHRVKLRKLEREMIWNRQDDIKG